jgi:hypothetical protein
MIAASTGSDFFRWLIAFWWLAAFDMSLDFANFSSPNGPEVYHKRRIQGEYSPTLVRSGAKTTCG